MSRGIAALLAAVALFGCASRTAPSVILIVIDTLRADYLGSYGFEGPVSPQLDRLAAESLRFERCISPAPWTKPAVASLFTALEPAAHGITNHHGAFWGDDSAEQRTGVLPESASTLAESLAAAGYRTAAFVANPWLKRRYGFDQGFEVYDDTSRGNTVTADDLLPRAREWLATHSAERFFLYLHLMDVHAPYAASEADRRAVSDSATLGPSRPLTRRETRALPRYFQARAKPEDLPKDLRLWRTRYAAGVHAVDRRLGPFIDELRTSGVLDRALLVLTSDHGEELAEHGGWDHGRNLYDHQLRVPLLVRRPGARGGGRVVDELVSLVDVMPTLLGLAGIDVPGPLQGLDRSALVRGRSRSAREAVLSGATKRRPGLHALRTPRHKLLLDVDSGRAKLFDLVADPGEQRDLAAEEPDTVGMLRGVLLTRLEQASASGKLAPEMAPVSPDEAERLEALGYAE